MQLSQVEKPASAVGQLEVPQEASASVAAPSTVDANPAIQPSAPPPPAPTLEVAALANTRDLAVIASQVVKEFDPSHQLAELTSSWAGFMAGASSFDERLKVIAPLLLFIIMCSTIFLSFVLSVGLYPSRRFQRRQGS